MTASPLALDFGIAGADDVMSLVELHMAAADALTREYGRGPWSAAMTIGSVARSIATARVLVARAREGSHEASDGFGGIVGTATLMARRPWAIDPAYFTPARRALYLIAMAVAPGAQRRGVGRALLAAATARALAWPADAIRLDAYDAPAGAGEFYLRCGWRERGRITYRGTRLRYFEWVASDATR